jgi:biopolymer transport protein ExbB/TolQ
VCSSDLYPLTAQNVMWVVFMLGLGELFVRWREAQAELRQLRSGYLPEDETTVLQAPDLRQIYARAREVAQPGSAGARRFLPRLIQRVAIQFQTSRSIEQASTLLNSSLELFLHEIDLHYSMTRYIIWLIPSLGFIGTVIGISLALAYAGEVDLQDPTLLAELTKRLAVAFNTTLLALVMSAVLVLIQHVVQAREEGVLNEVGQYCLDNLINRLYAG